jgi:hypothetical protein
MGELSSSRLCLSVSFRQTFEVGIRMDLDVSLLEALGALVRLIRLPTMLTTSESFTLTSSAILARLRRHHSADREILDVFNPAFSRQQNANINVSCA